MKKDKKTIWILFLTFLKIGAFTFGGGYAMIPMIQSEVVEKRKWISGDDLLSVIAIAESTPGPVAINAATFVGFKVCGFWGAVLATVGVIMPSFWIIAGLSFLLTKFYALKPVRYAFWGIRAGVLALIVKALYSMYDKTQKNILSYVAMIAAFVAVAVFRLNVLYVIIGCAVLGLVYGMVAERRVKR